MIEKYFIVKKDTDIYKEYFEWWNTNDLVRNTILDFLKLAGIESDKFYKSYHLGIVPTENDLNKFGKMLAKQEYENGLRLFKYKSTIVRDFKNYLDSKNVKILNKPSMFWEIGVSGKISTRLFHNGDVLYGSCNTQYDYKLPEKFEEIRASEFYKIYESIE